MSRKRKTVEVAAIVAKANKYFAAKGTREARLMLQVFVGSTLHETGNYKGFRYLESAEVPAGELPGIVRSKGDNQFPDDSRISFIW